VAGVNPKIVSERLGHSSVAFTMDVYSHVVPNLQETAAERFDELIFSASLDKNNVVEPPKLAQAQNREGMLANGRLDVGKMLAIGRIKFAQNKRSLLSNKSPFCDLRPK